MKKKRGLKVNIHLTNRWLYTFIAIGILAAIGVGVYAATYSPSGAGHPYTEISTCSANQILKMNSAGNAWECGSDTGITTETDPLAIKTETDPTVKSWAKTDIPIIPSQLSIGRAALYYKTITWSSAISCSTSCATEPSGVNAYSGECLKVWRWNPNPAPGGYYPLSCTDTTINPSYDKNCLCTGFLN